MKIHRQHKASTRNACPVHRRRFLFIALLSSFVALLYYLQSADNGSLTTNSPNSRKHGEKSKPVYPPSNINTALLKPLTSFRTNEKGADNANQMVNQNTEEKLTFAEDGEEMESKEQGEEMAEQQGKALETSEDERNPSNEITALEADEDQDETEVGDRELLLTTSALLKYHSRTRELADHVHALDEALLSLRSDANIAYQNTTVYTVVHKQQTPPSGDIHDYMSLARYFWPADTPDGLPYVKKDGYPNPEIETVRDYRYMRAVFKDVSTLGLAYYYFRDEKYAQKAIERIVTWFLNPATRMNPHLKYASLRKGSIQGSRMGVLDMYPAYRMFNVIDFLKSSKHWSPDILSGLQLWYTDYYTWLTTAGLGKLERNAHNNHGTYWDVQAFGITFFIGRNDYALEIAQNAISKRLESQINADGQQWAETERPTSWFYSVLNLHALMLVATFGDRVGVDLWHHVNSTTGNGSIKKAVDYLIPYALDDGNNWPFKNVGNFETRDFVRQLELAYIIYKDPTYLEAIDVLRKKNEAEGLTDKSQYLCQLGFMTRGNLWVC